MNRSIAAVTAILVGLGMAACGDRDTRPVDRPMVPPSETSQSGTSGPATQADPAGEAAVAAVVTALAPEKTFAEVTARIAPLFQPQQKGGGETATAPATGTDAAATPPGLAQLQERLPDVTAYQREALQQAFAPDELAQIAAFVATPAGQKFVTVVPQLQQETRDYAAGIANALVTGLVKQKLREGAVVAIEPLAPLQQPTDAAPAPASVPAQ